MVLLEALHKQEIFVLDTDNVGRELFCTFSAHEVSSFSLFSLFSDNIN